MVKHEQYLGILTPFGLHFFYLQKKKKKKTVSKNLKFMFKYGFGPQPLAIVLSN
jgi:hypothetical protein